MNLVFNTIKINRHLINIVALMCLGAALAGCSGCSHTLAPGGVYNGDNVLYEADNTITTGHDLLQQFVDWEENHRAALTQYPEIRKTADLIVDKGAGWFASAIAVRDAYKANPSEENKAALQSAVAVIRKVMTEVSGHLAKPVTGGVSQLPESPRVQ